MVRMADRLTFTKGHGTENDFVLVPDLDGALGLTAARAAALADRRAGIGGDGVIRVVPTDARRRRRTCAPRPARARWFMDYRNADGSLSRDVRQRHAGVRRATCAARGSRPPTSSPSRPAPASSTCASTATGSPSTSGPWRLTDADDRRARRLRRPGPPRRRRPVLRAERRPRQPAHRRRAARAGRPRRRSTSPARRSCAPSPPHGTNVELVRPMGPGHVAMRVHERGVGETRSCGTGACAAAIATSFWAGCARHRGDVAGRRARGPAHRAAAARPRGRAGRARGPRRRRRRRPRAPAALTAAARPLVAAHVTRPPRGAPSSYRARMGTTRTARTIRTTRGRVAAGLAAGVVAALAGTAPSSAAVAAPPTGPRRTAARRSRAAQGRRHDRVGGSRGLGRRGGEPGRHRRPRGRGQRRRMPRSRRLPRSGSPSPTPRGSAVAGSSSTATPSTGVVETIDGRETAPAHLRPRRPSSTPAPGRRCRSTTVGDLRSVGGRPGHTGDLGARRRSAGAPSASASCSSPPSGSPARLRRRPDLPRPDRRQRGALRAVPRDGPRLPPRRRAPPAVGSVFRNPDMARAYRELRTHGVDSLYDGPAR